MSLGKKQVRDRFREAVFKRDGHRCRICGWREDARFPDAHLDAHHITDRTEMPNGGYVPENGITLCPDDHRRAESFHISGTAMPGYAPDELYAKIRSSHALALKASEKLA